MEASSADVRHVRSEIMKLGGRWKASINGSTASLCCPFHKDTHPSFIVSLSKRYLGSGKCRACGVTSTWSELCAKLGMADIKPPAHEALAGLNFATSNAMLDLSSITKFLPTEHAPVNRIPWPADFSWRGIGPQVMRAIGAEYERPDKPNDRRQASAILPVRMFGKAVGEIRARIEKHHDKSIPSYVNQPAGPWPVRSLFPFDMIWQAKVAWAVLVEGPRDALAMIQSGCPALAMFGTNNWSPDKVSAINALNLQTLYIMMDGDEAGRKAQEMLSAQSRLLSPRVEAIALNDGFDPANLAEHDRQMFRQAANSAHSA